MTSEALKALAERVEGATSGDRELDELLTAWSVGATREEDATFDHKPAYHRDGFWVSIHPIEPLTSSIDAALGLVERVLPGWRVYLSIDRENGSTEDLAAGRVCGASICSPMRETTDEYGVPDVESDDYFATGTMLPLAILAALLRALLAKGE